MRINSYAKSSRSKISVNFSRARHKVMIRILSINTALNCMSPQQYIVLSVTKLLTRSYEYLFSYNINLRNHFSNTMFNLTPCIHLHKIPFAVVVKKKFAGSCTFISDSLSSTNSSSTHFFSCLFVNSRRRSFFQKFLMTSLN